ncbi:4322_t:CDS:2 [Cetraspora pellucida]|uniref:4322_t:CDS:1 n=1 Tax=Cetraspora pellucida TaxID=1433469 RepID=A0ACA9LN58_9GLOM|nr:4322_t:CDS:2 [Cetraspora pellucida]
MSEEEICEIVPFQKGNNKIKVDEYLMIKEKNNEDRYYWCCEKNKLIKYRGRAVTVLKNGLHYLKRSSEHIHAPQPSQLIQDNMNSIPEEVRPYMLMLSTLRRVVTRARKNEGLQEPQSASDLILPPSLCNTLGVYALITHKLKEMYR